MFAALTVLSLLPVPPQPFIFAYADLVEHALAYAAFTFLACMGLGAAAQRKPTRFLLPLAIFAWSLLIEFVQPYVGRYCDWRDMIANAVGVALGALAAYSLGCRFSR